MPCKHISFKIILFEYMFDTWKAPFKKSTKNLKKEQIANSTQFTSQLHYKMRKSKLQNSWETQLQFSFSTPELNYNSWVSQLPNSTIVEFSQLLSAVQTALRHALYVGSIKIQTFMVVPGDHGMYHVYAKQNGQFSIASNCIHASNKFQIRAINFYWRT